MASRAAIAWAALTGLACGGPARDFTLGSTCSAPGLAHGFDLFDGRVLLPEEETDVVRLMRFDCTIERLWSVPAGPRSVATLGADTFATANLTAQSLALASTDGGVAELPTGLPPNQVAAASLGASTGAVVLASFGVADPDGGWGIYAASDLSAVTFAPLSGASSIGAADLDADGHPEVLVGQQTQHQVSVFSGSAPFSSLGTVAACDEPFGITALTGKGAVVTCRTGGLAVLEGLPPSTQVTRLARDGTLYATVAADLDLDGFVDLAAVDPFAHQLALWWGSKNGFGSPVELAVPQGPVMVRAGDVDGDGDLDLIVLSLQAKQLAVLVNPVRGKR